MNPGDVQSSDGLIVVVDRIDLQDAFHALASSVSHETVSVGDCTVVGCARVG